MKKNTKTTLKVLSGIALAGTVAVLTDSNADAKTYKPEVRYQDGKYFVKTSDPATKGKLMAFSIKKPNSDEFLRISDEVNYNNQEVVIKKGFDEQFEGKITDNTLVAIQDEEKRPNGSEDVIDNPAELAKYKQEEKAFFAEAKAGGVTFKDAMKKEEKPKEEAKTTVTSTLAERFIDSLTGKVTPEGKLVYTIKSKEPLSGDVALRIYNDRNGKTDNHLHFNKTDDNTYVGDYSISSLQKGVYKPYELSFIDSNNKSQILHSLDLISYEDKSKVVVGEAMEEPINSPQLQGKKIGVFANYKKVKKGTVVKYTLKIANGKLKDNDYLLLHKEGQFDHVNASGNYLYDINGNRIVYIETDRLNPGIYNVFGFEGNSDYKLEDIYNEDGWFEVGNEDVRREGPAVSDTVPTTKPDETPKPTTEPQPGKDETPKPTPEPQPGKDEKRKPGKEETPKPSETSKPGKEEILKPGEAPKPGKEETLKPGEAPQPGKEETLKPGETPKPGKEETLKPSETAKPEKDNSWNPFAQGQKAKEGSTEVKSEGGEAEVKSVSNRKEGKALPNTGLQTTSYGFLAAIVGLFGAVALRRKNR